ATCIVLATENPSFLLASCCNVEVVNGAAGERFAGFFSRELTVNAAAILSRKKASASLFCSKRCGNSALNCSFPFPVVNCATILKLASALTLLISRSRYTISLTATDCPRPADNDGFTFFHNTGASSKPTKRSSTRRACCALTKLYSILRGSSIARIIAGLVISWKTIRFVLSSFNASVSYKCHEIASPSRSSSEANQTVSAALANFFNSLTTAFLSEGTSYFCSKLFATSIASSVFTKSRI